MMAIKITMNNVSVNADTIYTGPAMTFEAKCSACGHVENMLNVTEVKGAAKCPVCGSDRVSIQIS
jgi:putative FmdB family regulatory protein